MACHGPDGNGLELLGPPLVGAEWVTGSPKKVAAILLQGLMGPIKVKGETYTPAAAMPGLKAAPEITDTDLADVATFVRFAWNNGKGGVKPETISEVRKELGDRETTFTPEELLKRYP
jgi:mono/diheme cytochrome c family protein